MPLILDKRGQGVAKVEPKSEADGPETGAIQEHSAHDGLMPASRAIPVRTIAGQLTSKNPYVREWKYLTPRTNSRHKQLCLRGRNVTVGQLVGTIEANGMTAEQASQDMDLPLEVIKEALAYYEENLALIQEEAEAERQRLAQRGHLLEPPSIP